MSAFHSRVSCGAKVTAKPQGPETGISIPPPPFPLFSGGWLACLEDRSEAGASGPSEARQGVRFLGNLPPARRAFTPRIPPSLALFLPAPTCPRPTQGSPSHPHPHPFSRGVEGWVLLKPGLLFTGPLRPPHARTHTPLPGCLPASSTPASGSPGAPSPLPPVGSSSSSASLARFPTPNQPRPSFRRLLSSAGRGLASNFRPSDPGFPVAGQ